MRTEMAIIRPTALMYVLMIQRRHNLGDVDVDDRRPTEILMALLTASMIVPSTRTSKYPVCVAVGCPTGMMTSMAHRIVTTAVLKTVRRHLPVYVAVGW
jgi:hypothetical protein